MSVLSCARALAQQRLDGGVNRFICEGREGYAVVEAPMLDLLRRFSRRDLGQWSKCLELQKLVISKSFERATEIRIRLGGIGVRALA